MSIKEVAASAEKFRESQIKEEKLSEKKASFSEEDQKEAEERSRRVEIKEAGRKPEKDESKKLLKEAVKENPKVSKNVLEFAQKYKAKDLVEGGDFVAAYSALKKEAAKNGLIIVDGTFEDSLAHTLFVDIMAKKYLVETAAEMVKKGEVVDVESAKLINDISKSLDDVEKISEVGTPVVVSEANKNIEDLVKIGKVEALLEAVEAVLEARESIPVKEKSEKQKKKKSFKEIAEERKKLVEAEHSRGRLTDEEELRKIQLKEAQEQEWKNTKERNPTVKAVKETVKEIQEKVVETVVSNAARLKAANYPLSESPYESAKDQLNKMEDGIKRSTEIVTEDEVVTLAWLDGVRRVWRIAYLREKISRNMASDIEKDELKVKEFEDQGAGWGKRSERTEEGVRKMVNMGLDFERENLPKEELKPKEPDDKTVELMKHLMAAQGGMPMNESWVESQLKSGGFTQAEIDNFKTGSLNLIKSEWLEDTLFAFEENSDNPTIGQKLQMAMNYMSAVRKEGGAHEKIEGMWQKISDRRQFMEYFEIHKMASGDKAGDDTRDALRKKAETVFADEFGARRFTRYWKESFKIMQEIERGERYKKYLNSKSREDDEKFYLEIAQAHEPLYNALDPKKQEREKLKVKHAIRFWRMIGRQAILDSSMNTNPESEDKNDHHINTLSRELKGKNMRKRAYNEEKGHQALMRFDANTTKLNIGPTKETTFKGRSQDSKANELLQSVMDTGFRDFLAKLNDKELAVYRLNRNTIGFVENLSRADPSMEYLDFEQGIDSLGDDKKSLASRFSEWVNDTKDASKTQSDLLQFLLNPTLETAQKVDYLHLGGDALKDGSVLGIAWDPRFESYPEGIMTQREVDVFGSRRMFMKHRILWALIMMRKRDGTPLTKNKILTSYDELYSWGQFVSINAYDANQERRGYDVLEYIGLSKNKALTERYGSLFFGILLAFFKEVFNIK